MTPSADTRRKRGACYRAQVLIRERRFQEARALLDELAADGGFEDFAPGTVGMQLQLRFQYVHARALIATHDTERGRRMIIDLDQQLQHDGDAPLLSWAYRTRLVNDLGGRLSEIGEHERSVEIGEIFLETTQDNSRRHADALDQLAGRRIAFGFERECFAQLAATKEARAPLTIARSLFRYAEKAADQAVAIRELLAETDDTYRPQLLHARGQRCNARLRDASVSVLLSDEAAEQRLQDVESEAWELAQESRRVPGILETERIWRFGRVGACRAVRAALIAHRDQDASRALALRAHDLLCFSYKTRSSDGNPASPQTSMHYGNLLKMLGRTDDARQVFFDTHTHLKKRYGWEHSCTRLFYERATACEV